MLEINASNVIRCLFDLIVYEFDLKMIKLVLIDLFETYLIYEFDLIFFLHLNWHLQLKFVLTPLCESDLTICLLESM